MLQNRPPGPSPKPRRAAEIFDRRHREHAVRRPHRHLQLVPQPAVTVTSASSATRPARRGRTRPCARAGDVAVVDVLVAGLVQPPRAADRRHAAGQQRVQRARVVAGRPSTSPGSSPSLNMAAGRVARGVEAEVHGRHRRSSCRSSSSTRVNEPPNVKLCAPFSQFNGSSIVPVRRCCARCGPLRSCRDAALVRPKPEVRGEAALVREHVRVAFGEEVDRRPLPAAAQLVDDRRRTWTAATSTRSCGTTTAAPNAGKPGKIGVGAVQRVRRVVEPLPVVRALQAVLRRQVHRDVRRRRVPRRLDRRQERRTTRCSGWSRASRDRAGRAHGAVRI